VDLSTFWTVPRLGLRTDGQRYKVSHNSSPILLHLSSSSQLFPPLPNTFTMSDSKGHYSPVNTSEDSQPQPPAYTPSTAPSSPFIHPQQAGTSAATSSGLYPQLDHSGGPPSAPYQPTYQHPKFNDPSKPPPHVPQYFQQRQQAQQQPHASCMASPLILMKPPSRIEDLKAKPGVVVCLHCSYLVLTDTTPENGKSKIFSWHSAFCQEFCATKSFN